MIHLFAAIVKIFAPIEHLIAAYTELSAQIITHKKRAASNTALETARKTITYIGA